VLAWSEIPMQQGISAASAGRPAEAASFFDQALAAPPWDADTASIAAQSLAQAAEMQVPGAAELSIGYARKALEATPNSLSAAKALSVGQQYAGDLEGAENTLNALTL
jgi:tetratricopeptide (TPR) repeat protein